MHMGEWDFLWSITAKAMLAAEILRPGALYPGTVMHMVQQHKSQHLTAIYCSR
jgi:hypothetical protein